MATDAKDKPCEACNGTGFVDPPKGFVRPSGFEQITCKDCGGTGRVPAND